LLDSLLQELLPDCNKQRYLTDYPISRALTPKTHHVFSNMIIIEKVRVYLSLISLVKLSL